MRNKLPLLVGIGLPILLVLYILITNYLPGLFIKPKSDFLYTTNSYSGYNYVVVGNQLQLQEPNETGYDYNRYQQKPLLYRYNAIENKSTVITQEAGQQLDLDPSDKSPDGFKVSVGGSSGGYFFFPFSYSSRQGIYIKGKGLNKKIIDENYYNFKFLGWVIND